MRPWVRWVNRVRWVHPCAPRGSLGSFESALGVIVFTPVHTGGYWVLPGLLGSLGCALVINVFLRGRWGQLRAP